MPIVKCLQRIAYRAHFLQVEFALVNNLVKNVTTIVKDATAGRLLRVVKLFARFGEVHK